MDQRRPRVMHIMANGEKYGYLWGGKELGRDTWIYFPNVFINEGGLGPPITIKLRRVQYNLLALIFSRHYQYQWRGILKLKDEHTTSYVTWGAAPAPPLYDRISYEVSLSSFYFLLNSCARMKNILLFKNLLNRFSHLHLEDDLLVLIPSSHTGWLNSQEKDD